MRAIDTNVLVRLLTRDDPAQTERAEDFVSAGAWVSIVVLAETSWVLDSVYGVPPSRLADALALLLDHEHLVLQDADVVAVALDELRSRPALTFSECLVVASARKAGHVPLGTFDRALGKVANVEHLASGRARGRHR
jgi:predicted nucleic-acid-binding protein